MKWDGTDRSHWEPSETWFSDNIPCGLSIRAVELPLTTLPDGLKSRKVVSQMKNSLSSVSLFFNIDAYHCGEPTIVKEPERFGPCMLLFLLFLLVLNFFMNLFIYLERIIVNSLRVVTTASLEPG